MTNIAVLVIALLFVGWIISLFPSLIQWSVAVVGSLAAIVLLLPAPLYLFLVLFAPKHELREWMYEAGIYTFILWGIGAVIVAALFYQGWQASEHAEEE